jgi:uncharacterized membrane protein
MRSRLAWPALLLAWSAAVQVVYWLDLQFALRPLLTVAFLLICPGLALVRVIRVRDPWAELALAIALSIALATAVPAIMVYVDDDLNTDAALAALAGITAIAVVADLLRLQEERR